MQSLETSVNHANYGILHRLGTVATYAMLGAVLAGCGSPTYPGRVQGNLTQKYDSETRDPKKGGYTLDIQIANIVQGAELGLKKGDVIKVVLPKPQIPEPYSGRLRECLQSAETGRNECYVDISVRGKRGQGTKKPYESTGADVHYVEVKKAGTSQGTTSGLLEKAKEGVSGLWEKAKEIDEQYGISKRVRELVEGARKSMSEPSKEQKQ